MENDKIVIASVCCAFICFIALVYGAYRRHYHFYPRLPLSDFSRSHPRTEPRRFSSDIEQGINPNRCAARWSLGADTLHKVEREAKKRRKEDKEKKTVERERKVDREGEDGNENKRMPSSPRPSFSVPIDLTRPRAVFPAGSTSPNYTIRQPPLHPAIGPPPPLVKDGLIGRNGMV